MTVTILGGSAPSTPWLIEALVERNCALTLRLAGRTTTHLAAVARACRLLARDNAIRIESFERNQWPAALEGADIVLIQIREGGLEARLHDETFPVRYGIPGDEGLGPGGLAAAIRTWPTLREIFTLVRLHAPRALPLLLTSPAGLLIRATAGEFPGWPVYAICELPFTTLESLSPKPVSFGYTGVNHLGWLHSMEGHPDVPLKYLRLHFDRENALREPPRASALMRIRDAAFYAFARRDIHEIRAALDLRPAPWYTHAIAPLLAGVTTQPYFLTQPDVEGERAYEWTGRRFVALPNPEPPAFVRDLTASFLTYEQEALPAVLNPTLQNIQHALSAHPWATSESAPAAFATLTRTSFLTTHA